MKSKIAVVVGSTFREGTVMCAVAAVVSTAAPLIEPIMCFWRQIVSGLTAGAVKGKNVVPI